VFLIPGAVKSAYHLALWRLFALSSHAPRPPPVEPPGEVGHPRSSQNRSDRLSLAVHWFIDPAAESCTCPPTRSCPSPKSPGGVLVRVARIVHAADIISDLNSDPPGPCLLAIGDGSLDMEAPPAPADGRMRLTLKRAPGSTVRAMTMTVSDLAAEVGLSGDTVRYYERLGLLPPPARTAAGYRQYDAAAVQRLRFIKGAQRVGLRLREIGELLAIRDQGLCPCGHTEALLRGRMVEIDAQVAQLQAVRAELARMLDDYPGQAACRDTPIGQWWCEQEFVREGR
jgi:DNA-binding transcriptional MerR regulator